MNAPKKQKQYYSGKKKKHTLKIQIVANADNLKVICFDIAKGKTHDFRLFKESKVMLPNMIKLLADSGYQGICKIHKNGQTPFKATKKHKLSLEEKAYNKSISKNVFILNI